jgi:hypothetical protein
MSRTGRHVAARHRLVVLLLVGGLCLSACGSKSTAGTGGSASGSVSTVAGQGSSTTSIHLAKTKFVFHAGLAFGAFHHFIYEPLRAGDLNHPFTHKLTVIKAGLAALFVYHELKLALADAQADPLLSKLVAPITFLQNKINGLTGGIRSGHPDATGIQAANGSIGSVHALAAAAGQPISEQVPSGLG